jgi:ribosome-binding protein aMBF1 (putative translation factor)
MGFYFVDPDTYKKYKDEVMQYSQSVQVNYQEFLPEEKRRPGLSDKQIAEKLGLEEKVVREIRVVAERDTYPIDEWEKAIEFKDKACRDYNKSGISSVTKKYLDKSKQG